jgi:hypothetical protein
MYGLKSGGDVKQPVINGDNATIGLIGGMPNMRDRVCSTEVWLYPLKTKRESNLELRGLFDCREGFRRGRRLPLRRNKNEPCMI